MPPAYGKSLRVVVPPPLDPGQTSRPVKNEIHVEQTCPLCVERTTPVREICGTAVLAPGRRGIVRGNTKPGQPPAPQALPKPTQAANSSCLSPPALLQQPVKGQKVLATRVAQPKPTQRVRRTLAELRIGRLHSRSASGCN